MDSVDSIGDDVKMLNSSQLLPIQSTSSAADVTDPCELSSASSNALPITAPATKDSKVKRTSTFTKYPWVRTTDDGYYCACCKAFRKHESGPWVTMPVAKGNSKKLYLKAEKHAASIQHRLASEKADGRYGLTTVAEKVNIQANKRTSEETAMMKHMFRAAYFLFSLEIPHTTTWRPLMSTVASLDSSGRLSAHLQNASRSGHHLSSGSVTEILESYGEAMFIASKEELSSVGEFAILADECTDINGKEMLSICVRYIKYDDVIERFVCVVPVVSTTAETIYEAMLEQMNKYGLDPTKIVAASFDGASNFSGTRGGVQALLKQQSPAMVYVHCRSHALQLCLVKACQTIPAIKRVISMLNKLFTVFRGSAKRLNVLYEIEQAIDKESHKLVQPGDTRWLSHEASVQIVCKHYPAICLALEHIYQDAGNMSSDAGGLLLTLRKDTTVFVLSLLSIVLKPLARLSKTLQCATETIVTAMENVNAVQAELTDTSADLSNVQKLYDDMIKLGRENKVFVESDTTTSLAQIRSVSQKYLNTIIAEMKRRFSDDIGKIAAIQDILQSKPEQANFGEVCQIFRLSQDELQSEWRILRRLKCDLSTNQSLLELACKTEKAIMFPTFAQLARKILLLPIGTAGVERSFSTLNRILNSDRCRLLPDHVDSLMKVAIEGPVVPDVREPAADNDTFMQKLTDSAYKQWLKKPRRF